MNQIKIIAALFGTILLHSCSSVKNEVYWVSGMKTECNAGVGKMQCLNVYKGKNLDSAKWQNFYAPIAGFEFEEGYLQKIKVKATQLEGSAVPADGSSIKYELVKVLDKQIDNRTKLNGDWTLVKLNNAPINRMVATPKMTIDLSKNLISAFGGCNYMVSQKFSLTNSKINLGPLAITEKMCINKNIEPEFKQALFGITTYEVNAESLTFLDSTGNKILEFMKDKSSSANSNLHDIWAAIRINGNPINRMATVPRLEINLTDMRVMGSDGCNDYSGSIKEVNNTQLIFGNIASTKKMCPKMETADAYNKAIIVVTSYKLDGLNLILYDKDNKEVLAFLKVD